MKWLLKSDKFASRTLPFAMSDYLYDSILDYAKQHDCERFELKASLPESRKMRNWFEGGLVPLFVFLTGRNWEDEAILEQARDDIKREALGGKRANLITGKIEPYTPSSKGRERLGRVIEWLLQYLTENYDVHDTAVDTEEYKKWRDTVYPSGGPDSFIAYLLELGVLKRV